ncbi:MAG: hypothetical protein QOK39_1560 [Acidimicrobiaceae bacterium]|nr:hypothetical protein [Acidimicrobiaceae bacterium]
MAAPNPPPPNPWATGAPAWAPPPSTPWTPDPGPDGRAKVSRRRFLAGAAGVGVAGAAALALTRDRWSGLLTGGPPAGQSLATGKGILVLVTLYGGNDGLNTVIPYLDSSYLNGRPTLGYPPDQVIPLGDGLALHPNMKGMKALWDAKELAVVRGVGYPNPVLSHFRGMDIWQTGSPDHPVATGVFGRWLDATGSDPMRAISIGNTLPRLLTGEHSSGTAIAGGTITLPGDAANGGALASLVAPGPDRSGLAAQVAQSGSDLLEVQHTLSDLLSSAPASPGAPAGPPAPNKAGKAAATAGTLTEQLAVVAQLITAGASTRVYQVSMGGFDNHSQEKDTHARLMGELDTAISGFLAALRGHPKGQSAVLMTYSEFGRRVAENLSGGTDHGTAAPLFVAGPAVKGGQFYGEEPSLTDLDNGNLKFTTDFRQVLATMLADVVGVDPTVALAGRFPTLKIL